jgi:8-oxo-dGTP pyrophosphatase MutT (NUDIX family)
MDVEFANVEFGKRLSCGVVIVNEHAELLLCHVTGQGHWDLPKGGANDGETPIQAALRETREETGLVLAPDVLVDLGRMPFRLRKDLHLFATLLPRLDPGTLVCESRFAPLSGGTAGAARAPLPEMDGFGWFAFDAVAAHCSRKLAAVLTERVHLRALLARLQRAAPAPVLLAA